MFIYTGRCYFEAVREFRETLPYLGAVGFVTKSE